MSLRFTSGAGFVTKLLPIILAVSCASTSRTKYQSYEKQQGYRDLPSENNLRVGNFTANAYTNKDDAELFAKFRAIEICKESGFKLTHMLDVKDKSVSKDVIRSSGTGFPNYYYGMSPYYNRFSGFNIGMSSMSSSSWEETYTYPEYTVYFDCVNSAFGPELILRDVTPEEMKLLVKDLKGGLQVEQVMESSPNVKILEEGDVILKVLGQRVQTQAQLLKVFSAERRSVPVEIMREGVRKTVTLKSNDVSEFIAKSQDGIIQNACGKKEIKKRSICGGEAKEK
ncbi:MAG TPA: PDZ domain-containing protein [Bacteriovoracaceae bacterium]|nr:PDZ domain-containing protein [Bacteriovoracaceae bacterium]